MSFVIALTMMDLLKDSERNEIISQHKKELTSLVKKFQLTNCVIIESSAELDINVDAIFNEAIERCKNKHVDSVKLLESVIKEDYKIVFNNYGLNNRWYCNIL
ncbi:predicted protein [Naegleria gruberi]|uniref:Predicted protein n=1 Tax=Naegleria gruberi TaxID=5762 RepID=D2VMP4_NAEGR|nr:uncharacterized protein NAEGRDRAFT_70211 [Naegleria gruberi]EFC41866.1 predicted protein [Naegleria gruberi]|eukprot:XP_002674610.1 predicted protein [Naegleria gruberi strain NEG-M]